jgi:hypothetical protein
MVIAYIYSTFYERQQSGKFKEGFKRGNQGDE